MKRLSVTESVVSEFGRSSSDFSSCECADHRPDADTHSLSSDNDDDITVSRVTVCSRRPVIKKVELGRSITFFGVVFILIANIGGTGIFLTPSTILRLSGSPGMAVILWSLGGLIQVLLAFCVVELAQIFNKAGGPYYFITHTFGDLAGFVFMWGYVIFIAAPSWSLGAYTASLYLFSSSLMSADCPRNEGGVKFVAVWIMITVIFFNCMKATFSTAQRFLVSCKVIALLVIIIFGFMKIPTESGQDRINHFMDGTTSDIGKIALALLASYYGCGGWPIITVLAGEVKKPEKNIPYGLAFSFAVLLTLMVAASFSYYVVLSKEESFRSEAIAKLFGEALYPDLQTFIIIVVCLSSIGTLNFLIAVHPRMMVTAAKNGHMPKIMMLTNKTYHSPLPAIFALGFLGIILLVFGNVMFLVEIISLYAAFMMLMLLACLFTLRWKHPGLPRPIKVPIIIPIVVTVLTVALVILSVTEMPRELGTVVLVVALGVPMYYFCVKLQAPGKLLNLDVLAFYLQLSLNLRYENK